MRDHLSWHYDHHMGDQDMNFGVVWSWVDALAGTRAIFVGTEHEARLHAKHSDRATTAAAGAELRARRRNPFRVLAKKLVELRAARVRR
jgi:sterol desaturase/sphingolipid hydroxylase (fatty acid hydroxylase superfamily)